MKIRTYPMLFTDCRNSVGKYFLHGPPPRSRKDPQTPGPDWGNVKLRFSDRFGWENVLVKKPCSCLLELVHIVDRFQQAMQA